MRDQYRLVGMGNSELLAGLSALVRQSNELTAQVLAHLVELDERMLHLELGFSSLFSYCVEGLGMSEGAAGRRVAAARVCRRFAGVFERVARGDLHLCALCAVAPHLTVENATELLDACRGKTRRQIEELLAARFPRPDVREQIRRLPARASAALIEQAAPALIVEMTPSVETAPSVETTPSVDIARSRLSAAIPVNSSAPAAPPSTTPIPEARRRGRDIEPLSADRFGVHFTADAELRELIERARALASHRLPNQDLASLMKLMAQTFVRHEEKRRFGIGARPRRKVLRTQAEAEVVASAQTSVAHTTLAADESERPPSEPNRATPPGEVFSTEGAAELLSTPEPRRLGETTPHVERRRYVPVEARRETHGRDGDRCAFVSASGRRCTARAYLEIDHLIPFARGGGDHPLNLRLLCWAHNRLHARHCFGALHLAAKVAAKKRAR